MARPEHAEALFASKFCLVVEGDLAIPTSQAFWDDLMAGGAAWGMAVYEQGRKRVIQRRFNVSVPRARVSETAPTLRERSER